MPMIPRVSIIVPVYNVEKYLAQCLDSLFVQTLTDIEIIAVNDGSTDSSPEILGNYAVKDNRLKIINKSNGGLGDARNTGLAAAKGEYIGFVDSDDWIDRDMYEVMYAIAQKANADIVMCNFVSEMPNGNVILQKVPITPGRIYKGIEIKKEILIKMVGISAYQENFRYIMNSFNSVWKNMYRRDFIIGNNLRFVSEREFFAEDLLFNLNAYSLSASLIATDKFLYHARVNPASLVHKYRQNMIGMHSNLYRYIQEFLKSHDMGSDCYRRLYARVCIETNLMVENTLKKTNPAGFIEKWQQIKDILNNPVIIDAFNIFSFHQFPFKNKMFFTLAKYRMALSVLVLYGWIIPFWRKQCKKRS